MNTIRIKEHNLLRTMVFSGLAELHNVLTPRTRGLYLAVRELHHYLDYVYDVTIAYDVTRKYSHDEGRYSRTRAPQMVQFIQSFSPKMHVNVRRIDMKKVPHENEEEIKQWLHTLFERKDRYVHVFGVLW